MPLWLSWLFKGLALGLAVSGINYFILLRLTKRAEEKPEKSTKNILLGYYLIRYIINISTLIIAYFFLAKSVPFLIGTAFGLTIPNNFYIFKFSKRTIKKRKE